MSDEFAYSESSFQVCSNCGAATALRYCGHCGQKQRTPEDYRLAHFLSHALNEFTHLDSKIFRSLKELLVAPGRLTVEWAQGRERRYVKPLQLFVIANVFYFLFNHFAIPFSTFTSPLEVQYSMQIYSPYIQPIVDARLAASHLTFDQFAKTYDEVSTDQARSLIIIMIPMFAALVALLHYRKRRYFVEHLVFSLNFYSFFLIFLTLAIAAIDLGVMEYTHLFHVHLSGEVWEAWGTLPAGILTVWYLYAALRKAYGGRWWLVAAKSFVLTFGILYIIFAYRFILFFTTMYAIHFKAA